MLNDKSVEADQQHFDRAYEAREQRRARLAQPEAAAQAADSKSSHDLRIAYREALARMRGPEEAVAFGRTDGEDGETYYIGYGLITDDHHDPLVISWQSRVGSRFYQASQTDPMGLTLKRVFETSVNTIIDHHDETFGGPDEAPVADGYQEMLLHELAGHRSGRMRDVVKTLQAHQDRVMRMPADQVLIIDGGPGTGKTIVGLQRVSILLYRGDVAVDDVAFVGPTEGYLRYVSNVLPSLGSEGVSHLSLVSLAPGAPPIRGEDEALARRVKGDGRMRELVERAVADRRRVPEESIELALGRHRIELDSDRLWEVMRGVEESGVPHNVGRRALIDRLGRLVAERTTGSVARMPMSAEDVVAAQPFMNLVNRLWPRLTPQEGLRDLLSSRRRLSDLSWSLFDDDEIESLFRPAQQRLSDERWTRADIGVLDAFAEELSGSPQRRFRHIIVDEVQDLSPMQLASLRRRSVTGVFTLLGDLGQGFGPFARSNWSSLLDDLGVADGHESVSLDESYRIPASMMELAALIAEEASIPTRVPTTVRDTGVPPTATRVSENDVLRTTVARVRECLTDGLSVGVIAAAEDIERISGAFEYEGVAYVDGREDLSGGVTIVPALESRGFEFDACVVVEPARIVDEAPFGLNLLYVVVSRATRRLAIVHADELPGPMSRFFGEVEGEDEDQPHGTSDEDVQLEPVPTPAEGAGVEALSDAALVPPDRVESKIDRAISILRMVAEGHTYEQVLAAVEDATYVEIFNAAGLGSEALASRRDRGGPPRAGLPWDEDEDRRLIESVRMGVAPGVIADEHERTQGAIRSRITRLVAEGRLEAKYLPG